MSEFIEAARQGDVPSVRDYIQAGIDVNQRETRHGGSALYWASSEGHNCVLGMLLRANALPDVPTLSGAVALHAAADNGHCQCVMLLIVSGAKVNIQSWSNDNTPLHLAAYRGYLDVVRVLVERGAALQLCNRQGRTPRQEALARGHTKVVNHLVKSERIDPACNVNSNSDLVFRTVKRPDVKQTSFTSPLTSTSANTTQAQGHGQTPAGPEVAWGNHRASPGSAREGSSQPRVDSSSHRNHATDLQSFQRQFNEKLGPVTSHVTSSKQDAPHFVRSDNTSGGSANGGAHSAQTLIQNPAPHASTGGGYTSQGSNRTHMDSSRSRVLLDAPGGMGSWPMRLNSIGMDTVGCTTSDPCLNNEPRVQRTGEEGGAGGTPHQPIQCGCGWQLQLQQLTFQLGQLEMSINQLRTEGKRKDAQLRSLKAEVSKLSADNQRFRSFLYDSERNVDALHAPKREYNKDIFPASTPAQQSRGSGQDNSLSFSVSNDGDTSLHPVTTNGHDAGKSVNATTGVHREPIPYATPVLDVLGESIPGVEAVPSLEAVLTDLQNQRIADLHQVVANSAMIQLLSNVSPPPNTDKLQYKQDALRHRNLAPEFDLVDVSHIESPHADDVDLSKAVTLRDNKTYHIAPRHTLTVSELLHSDRAPSGITPPSPATHSKDQTDVELSDEVPHYNDSVCVHLMTRLVVYILLQLSDALTYLGERGWSLLDCEEADVYLTDDCCVQISARRLLDELVERQVDDCRDSTPDGTRSVICRLLQRVETLLGRAGGGDPCRCGQAPPPSLLPSLTRHTCNIGRRFTAGELTVREAVLRVTTLVCGPHPSHVTSEADCQIWLLNKLVKLRGITQGNSSMSRDLDALYVTVTSSTDLWRALQSLKGS